MDRYKWDPFPERAESRFAGLERRGTCPTIVDVSGTMSLLKFAKGFMNNRESSFQLLIRDDQRHQGTDDIGVGPC